jgi:hypothetical protein
MEESWLANLSSYQTMSDDRVSLKMREPSFLTFLIRAQSSKLERFQRTRGAHTLLRTVIWLFIPASVQL